MRRERLSLTAHRSRACPSERELHPPFRSSVRPQLSVQVRARTLTTRDELRMRFEQCDSRKKTNPVYSFLAKTTADVPDDLLCQLDSWLSRLNLQLFKVSKTGKAIEAALVTAYNSPYSDLQPPYIAMRFVQLCINKCEQIEASKKLIMSPSTPITREYLAERLHACANRFRALAGNTNCGDYYEANRLDAVARDMQHVPQGILQALNNVRKQTGKPVFDSNELSVNPLPAGQDRFSYVLLDISLSDLPPSSASAFIEAATKAMLDYRDDED